MTEKKDNTLYCSFCGKSQHQVKKLIAGPIPTFICDECVQLCMDVITTEDIERKYRERLRNDGYIIIHESKLNPELVTEIKSKDTSLDRFNQGRWN